MSIATERNATSSQATTSKTTDPETAATNKEAVTQEILARNLNSYVAEVLDANAHNRLESILSELVVFAMNAGTWGLAAHIHRAYQRVAKPYALGPMVAATYIAMGYNRLGSAIQALQDAQANVLAEDLPGLQAFIGMFMYYNGDTEDSKQQLESVLKNDQANEMARGMASELLESFFGVSMGFKLNVDPLSPGQPRLAQRQNAPGTANVSGSRNTPGSGNKTPQKPAENKKNDRVPGLPF